MDKPPKYCIFLLFLYPVVGGCEAPVQTAGPPVVTDSAGVTIILNRGPQWERGEGWRLSRKPVVTLGDSEDDERYQFVYLSDSHRLPDGRIAVVDSQGREVKLYDSNGVYLGILGGRGEGPGEYRQPYAARGYRGDSILVYDGWRYQLFDSQGVFGRVMQAAELLVVWPPLPDHQPPSPHPSFSEVFSDGSFLVRYTEVKRITGPGTRRGTVKLVRLDPDGTTADSLVVYPAGRYFPEPGWRYPVSEHFGLTVSATVHGDEVFVGNGEEFRVDVLDRDGVLKRSIRVEVDNPPLTEALKASFEERERERLKVGTPESTDQMLEDYLSLPFPERLPAFERILVDELGNLWAGHWPEEEFSFYPDRYTVFDPAGVMLGSVEFPDPFNVKQIGADFVLGTWRDEWDVHHVLLYDLVKPGT